MKLTGSGGRGRFWRSDWFAAALIVVVVWVVHQTTQVFSGLERQFYDKASTSASLKPSDRIALITIDDQSIANLGRWPWPRDIHAKMIDLLAQARVKTVANTVFFFEPQTDRGLVFIRKLKSALGPSGSESHAALMDLVAEAERTLDTDAQLVASMSKAANVLTPSFFVLGEPQGRPDSPLPEFALKNSVADPSGFSISAMRSQQPIDGVGLAAVGVGHLNQFQDMDGTVRQEPLLVNYFGKAIPSMALLTALHSLNLSMSDLRILPGEGLALGRLKVRTDDQALMLPQFYKDRDGKPAFATDSFFDVLTGKIPASKYADKIVIIGATAAGVGVQFPVPGHPGLSPAQTLAHITSGILSEHFIVQPPWAGWVAAAAFLLVASYLLVGLPRLPAAYAAVATGVMLLVLLGSEFFLLSSASIWVQLIFPSSLLLVGHLLMTTKRFLLTEAGKVRADEESAETNRMMGLALQGQGQLDMAFDRFRRVPLVPGIGDAVLDNLYNLALDFERKRQFNKAQAVYEHMAGFNPKYKDLQSKLSRAKNLSETVILGGGSAHPGGTLLLDGGAVEKPMLGRYQVEKELGKGAMGVVYLGKDPKIGRVVAIKTMALSQEFEGSELDDARERFFREAETAGRLQHQHIVTIFDAGEEHDLAYIAMEFLKGRDLVDFCRSGNLLPVDRVLSIVSRVAVALAYAHRQNVVHRDIKPANIMYELETDTVKVTDFGIARITDSSKTKTGLVLGTPSFMSPEQIAGKRVDGRSDLYSLGVMLFQMLTGVLPFRGESMAALMFKIANEEAPDVRTLRPELPAALASVVALALTKRPEIRYQDGEQFANDLNQVAAGMNIAAISNQPVQSKDMPVEGFATTQKMMAPSSGSQTAE